MKNKRAIEEPLSQDVWSYIQITKREGATSIEIAREKALPLKEVNYAYCCHTYELYLRERRVRRRGKAVEYDPGEERIKMPRRKRGNGILGMNEFGLVIVDDEYDRT